MSKNVTRRELYSLIGTIGLTLTLLLCVGAGLAAWGNSFATSQVRSQLTQEKITFPAAGSAALDPQEFPGLQQYGGQAVNTGDKAKAYADQFIWVHMMKASGGQTYAQVSTAAMASPTNQQLATLKSTLFQGDMLRSSLLTAYAFSVLGAVAGYALIVLVIGAALMLVLSLLSFHVARQA